MTYSPNHRYSLYQHADERQDDLHYKLAGYERESLLFDCWVAIIIWFSLRLLFDGTEYSLSLEYSCA